MVVSKCLVCGKEATNAVYEPQLREYCTEHFYQVYPEAKLNHFQYFWETHLTFIQEIKKLIK